MGEKTSQEALEKERDAEAKIEKTPAVPLFFLLIDQSHPLDEFLHHNAFYPGKSHGHSPFPVWYAFSAQVKDWE